MIHEFTVKNHRSLRDSVKVNLRIGGSAPNLERYRPSVVDKGVRLPTVAALAGPNGAGKSNVLLSLKSVLEFISYSALIKPDEQILGFFCFLSTGYHTAPTEFELVFDATWPNIGERLLFKYQLILGRPDEVSPSPKEVLHESLHFAPKGHWKRVFEHKKGDNIYLSKEFGIGKGDKYVFDAVGENRSVISVLARIFQNPLALKIWNDIGGIDINFNKSPLESRAIAELYESSPETLQALNSYVRRIDVGISNIGIESSKGGIFLTAKHDGLDVDVPFGSESKGTQHFTLIFPGIKYALDSGSLLIIDEFDRDLHPDLAVEILSWFQSPETNPHGAQIFCTLHNTEVLNALEKEELFIVEKDREGVTHVWGAQDVKGLRRDVDLAKKYRQGALGGLPRIG